MTRKDYELLAAGFAESLAAVTRHQDSHVTRWAVEVAAKAQADRLAADNPRFNRNRFLAACEVSP